MPETNSESYMPSVEGILHIAPSSVVQIRINAYLLILGLRCAAIAGLCLPGLLLRDQTLSSPRHV